MMELSYWQSRWQKDKTGWHMENVYPPLPKLWPELPIKDNAHIVVPLCGKSLDMQWLLEQGYRLTGIETSHKALQKFMALHSGDFEQDTSHGYTVYRAPRIELWQGNFLKFPVGKTEKPNLIYDKAAMIALPHQMRASYAEKILELAAEDTSILLQTFEYEQEEMNGPPFSVKENEIKERYSHRFTIKLLLEQSKFDQLTKFRQRGLSSYLIEKVYLLEPL